MRRSDTTCRREFLAWLFAVPVVACSSSSGAVPPATTPGDVGEGDDPSHHEGEDAASAPDAPVTIDGGGCEGPPTLRDLEGPYYENGAPVRAAQLAAATEAGVRLLVEGRILGPNCKPLGGYALDVWQADKDGNYYGGAANGYRLRGKIVSDANGRYRFETVLPGRYGDAAGIRPAHLHVKVRTPMDGVLLTTQLYFAGDPYLGDADYCTRAGSCNSADPARHLVLADVTIGSNAGKRTTFDAILAKT